MELTRNIILGRLQLVGYVMRSKDKRALKKVLKACIEGRNPVGSHRGNARTGDSLHATEMCGGRVLKRPRPKLGCSATGGRGEEEVLTAVTRLGLASNAGFITVVDSNQSYIKDCHRLIGHNNLDGKRIWYGS
jgi:hypothetical protein